MNNKQIKQLKPILIVVIGVSGCGKSTVAEALARHYKLSLVEADDFHSDQAIAQMAAGQPLDNEMRRPWVEALCRHLHGHFEIGNSCVMAFSGLAKCHRDAVRALPFNTLFVHLRAKQAIIKQRSENRNGHFMPACLLKSQYQALEDPSQEHDVIDVDVEQTVDKVILQAINHKEKYFNSNKFNILRR